ncbi:dihydroxyacetone kinase subunit DhaL [Streptomyces sp. NPDC006368]|uniref:dihydroxyacetone kinase subunit DhaL n=1 Tax=Streptomyces sp. NPDC006368 TaxID=3156760 RepID=UPI0033A24E05
MTATAAAVDREADRLTELDSAIGDADHGANLQRGFAAVVATLDTEDPAAPGAVLMLAGRQLISTVGGASGPLYGTLLRRAGKALGDSPEVTAGQLAEALRGGVAAVARLGGAKAGDKTMLDALEPAVEAMGAAADGQEGGSPAGEPPAESAAGSPGAAFAAAARAAEEGARATVPMQARKGRASYLGERSVGHQDPGATSSALLIAALAEAAR